MNRITVPQRAALPAGQGYRVWILGFDAPPVRGVAAAPRRAVALEPGDARCLTAHEAAEFVDGFNAVALANGAPVWAVAVPVAIRYEGDLQAGQEVPIEE